MPVYRGWGILGGAGSRPVYGEVIKNGHDGQEDVDGERRGERDGARDEGLLVDKYRSCALCGVFEGITSQLVDIVEGRGSGDG